MKKFVLFLVVVLIGAGACLIATGKISLAGLKSDALGADECTPEYLIEKSELYHEALIERQQHMNEIHTLTAAVTLMEEKKNKATDEATSLEFISQITEKQSLIAEHQKQVQELSTSIDIYEACKQSLIIG